MLRELNPPQRDAVTTLSGPLLVLAGAGSGKTRVVTYRIAELIRTGTRPDRILAVTFTNKAADEMQQRISEQLGKRRKSKPVVSTFHSQCVRILRQHISLLGYPKRFAIYDRGDQESVARSVLRDIKVPGALLKPGDLLWFISQWKTSGKRPDAAASEAATDREHLAAMGYRRYQKSLKMAGAVDFDDLLLCTEQLFEEFPDARREEAGRFDHLLVDEYQDTNTSQYRIVKALAMGHRNLCVVGDDDQSIYAWRGAEVKHILQFKRDWPDAKVVRLEENYRSTDAILKIANRLIRYNKVRHDKILRAARPGGDRPQILQFETETAEAEEIVADIRRRLTQPGCEPRDIAILFRTNEQPRVFEAELRRKKIPYVLLGGQSFFDRKEVRDLLAYLKVISYPKDEVSLLRIINTPPRGIGQKTVEILLQRAIDSGVPIWNILTQVEEIEGITPKAAAAVTRFVSLIRQCREQAKRGELTTLTTNLIQQIGYQEELERIYNNPNEREARWASVEQVVSAVSIFEKESQKPTLKEFIDATALDPREPNDGKEKQLRRNAIVLMTLHAAKGLEFPQVYMVGMEEGILPHHRSVAADGDAIAEERRLCYVGVTRAKDRLTLSLALSRTKWGKPRPTQASRFLFEITGQAEKS